MVNLIIKLREVAHVREFAAKHRASERYNSQVKAIDIQEGVLILNEVVLPAHHRKLQPN